MGKKIPKLLAIDDNQDNLAAFKAVVRDILPGCKLWTGSSGPQGIELARAEDPDVILLDIEMPGMDGFEVCRRLKADEWLSSIPVIFLTAVRADRASRIKALEVGAEAFLSKPLDELELVAQIRAMVKLKAANRLQRQEKEQLTALVVERTFKLEQELTERNISMELLRLANNSQSTKELIESAIVFFRQQSGCEAVGVRLHEGEDYPYYEARGFPDEFVRLENSLCARNESGQTLHDDDGNPVIECMCGNVICGRFDPSKPFFTAHGSFWTNSTTQLLASTTDADRQTRTRNRCHGEGYESVALLPLRVGGETLGLLQLNDRRPGRFTLETIGLWERLAGNLAVALSKLRADEALKEGEAKTRLQTTALNAVANGILITDPQGIILWTNPAFTTLTGYTGQEAYGRNPRFLKSGQHSSDFYKNLWDTILHGQVWRGEMINRHKSGHLYVEETTITPVCGANGQITHFIGVNQDVTSRKQDTDQIRAQAGLLDLTLDSITVQDINGCIQYCNKGCERQTGWTAAEMLGRSSGGLFKRDPAVSESAMKALLKEGNWSGEYDVTAKDGHLMTILSRWTLVRDDLGQPKSVLIISTDITEKKKLETLFLRAQRLEGIGALASGIAHDLNNILAPVLMIAPLLSNIVKDEESRAMLGTITGCARRGAGIIKQLLTFARGKPGSRVPLPVRHLIREMDKIVRETFPRNIHPRVDTSENLWMVMADATQLQQILMNLSVNARDAMPEGGTLTLGARNIVVDEAFASRTPGARPGSYVCVTVSDTGTGIAPENFEHIFDPFFTTKEPGKGTGLGLPTVMGLVQGHEGFIRVDSQVGHGTTFELYFPALPEAQAAATVDREPPPPRGQGELILVVDDEASVRDGVRRILENQGYRVLMATQGAEGLEAFSRKRKEIRAVLTDMMMPVMSGPSMIAAIRGIAPDQLILGMTGLTEQTGVKNMKNLDIPALLIKPFSGDDLLRALHAALHASGAPGTIKGVQ